MATRGQLNGLTRRDILALPFAESLRTIPAAPLLRSNAIGFGAFLLAAAPGRAQAEPVTICLAVASAVAGLVAAHNRSDGGMGAILKANLEYQRVISQQLASLQEGMAEVLTKLNALPTEVRKILYEERLASLHAKLGVQILRYRQEASVRASRFTSYQAWAQDGLTRSVLSDINNHLDQAAAEVMRGRWFDSLTALYLTAAVYASLGVRAALGDKPTQLMAEAQRYLDLFSAVESSDESGSAAADLVLRNAAIKQLRRELAKQGYRVTEEDNAPPTDVRLGRIAIQDYTPRTLIKAQSECRLRNPRNPDLGERCVDTSIYAPERLGEIEAFGFFVRVLPAYIEDGRTGAEKISIRQYVVAQDIKTEKVQNVADVGNTVISWGVRGAFNRLSVPIPSFPPTLRADARTADARKLAANKSDHFVAAQIAHKQLAQTADRLNEELARSALDAAALMAVSSTRQGVFRFFGREA